MAVDTMSRLLAIGSRRQLPAEPADELRGLQTDLAEAESRGDQQAIDEASAGLDRLFEQAREHAADERRAIAENARFASGVRKSVARPKSASEQMAEVLLVSTGRRMRR